MSMIFAKIQQPSLGGGPSSLARSRWLWASSLERSAEAL